MGSDDETPRDEHRGGGEPPTGGSPPRATSGGQWDDPGTPIGDGPPAGPAGSTAPAAGGTTTWVRYQARSDLVARRRKAARRRRRGRILLVVAVVLLLLITPVAYSYISYMTRPSNVPWTIRNVEYLREHHFAWLVNEAENIYYSWTAPKKGGPGITALPSIGVAESPRPRPSASATVEPPYGPPRVEPVIEPALEDEGVWRAVTKPIDGAAPILATTFRPERDYPSIIAYVAWIDWTRTRLALYPGVYEPPHGTPRGPAMIPEGQRQWALGGFNSGFTKEDLGGGWAIDGRVYDPLVAGRGTVVAYRNGKVDVISWRQGMSLKNVVLARQNLPLIVNGGKRNPALSETLQWGYTLDNRVRVWRTAVGVDRKGNLVYGAADKQTVITMADIMIRAGAVRAIELDINTHWPTFLAYGNPGCQNPVRVVPNYEKPLTRFTFPDDRDFFVVYKRQKGVEGNPGIPWK